MKNDKPQIIERIDHPTEFDTAPYLSFCFCEDNTLWVQASQGELPKWLELPNETVAFIKQIKSL